MRRILKLSTALILGLLTTFYIIIPTAISLIMVHFRAPVCCTSPADFGLEYQSVTFPTEDGIMLSGWYLPSQNGAAIIALHGSNSNRTNVLNHAAMLARHGYGVLLFDLRGHGDSEGLFTLGWEANQDIDAALAYLRSRPEVDANRIGGLGLSMGGEVLLQAAAHTELIRAVVSDGAGIRTFDDFLSIPGAEDHWLLKPFV